MHIISSIMQVLGSINIETLASRICRLLRLHATLIPESRLNMLKTTTFL